jgi:hypothetical protein
MLVDTTTGKELKSFYMVRLASNELVTLFSWEEPTNGSLGKVCIIDGRGIHRTVSPVAIHAEFRSSE